MNAKGTEELRAGEAMGGISEQSPRAIAAMDFFTVPMLTFGVLHCFL
jgi:hypothetical protein